MEKLHIKGRIGLCADPEKLARNYLKALSEKDPFQLFLITFSGNVLPSTHQRFKGEFSVWVDENIQNSIVRDAYSEEIDDFKNRVVQKFVENILLHAEDYI